MPVVGDVELVCNTPSEARARNASGNAERAVERFHTQAPHDGHVCIVGGGPSLADCLEELRWRQSIGQHVWATNNTFSWLTERGITPEAHVLLDARKDNAAFVVPTRGVTYYLNNSCDPSIFDALSGERVVMYDLGGEGTGTTVGLKALYLAGFSGFRKFHLYGFDSSYRGDEHHAYRQALNDAENRIDVTVDGVTFRCAPWMMIQAEEFQQIAASFAEQDCVITVAGSGLLPHIASVMARPKSALTAVYDLAVSPPTYDFLGFLVEAEKARIAAGHTQIDVVFMPGPAGGFRADNLPPSIAEREGMLHRVCVSSCRLLPSVRNVTVLKDRQELQGSVFPHSWTERNPVSHYGSLYFKNALRVLRATESAKRATKRSNPYVTITMRQAEYWPDRNSNISEWEKVAAHLKVIGYEVVWLNDTSIATDAVSWDIDFRLATYEGAVCNLGVSNGPMAMLYLSRASYIVFKLVVESAVASTKEFLKSHGMEEGDQWSDNGKTVWADDTAERIIEEFDGFMKLKEAA